MSFLQAVSTVVEWLQAMPWLLLLVYSLPFVVLAATKRIYPNLPLVLLLGIPSVLTLALLVWSDLFLVVAAADVIVGVLAFADVWTFPRRTVFSAERTITRVASLGVSNDVTLIVASESQLGFQVEVRDDVPQEFDAEPASMTVQMQPRSQATLRYRFVARQRGKFQLNCVYLRIRSRLGLWRRYTSCPLESEIFVYPDMKQLAEYAVLARTNRLSLMGVRRTRKIGQDNEFERLRDYTFDDNYKHIDWRSTARRNKLTVKDFQTNQSQRIIFLLDCGRMMTNEAAGLSLLDHSLNAMLMLSFVALRQGDSAGLVCFSDQVHTFVPPKSGMNQMNRLLHASFDRFPRLVESRYDEAFLYLASHCRKRSLVILITNLIDEVNSLQIYQYLGNLVGRHLPLGVLLRDRQLFGAADEAYVGEQQMYRAAAAAQIITWRHQVLTDLEHRGVLALDVFPEEMTAPLVNSYLDIKARHLL